MLRVRVERLWLVTIRQFGIKASVVTERIGGRVVPSRMKMMPSLGLSGIVRLPGCNQKLIIDTSGGENCPVRHICEETRGRVWSGELIFRQGVVVALLPKAHRVDS